ncbi:hypothetical protein, partial [Aeromonas caviae]|uniref:hypothetical protein n=1 Tax=Aeromonas caviae TaxID=648 RepID=UPI001F422583
MTVGLFHLRNPTCLQQVFSTKVFPTKKGARRPNASQLSLTGIVFTRFSRRILLWFGFDAPWVTSFSAGG